MEFQFAQAGIESADAEAIAIAVFRGEDGPTLDIASLDGLPDALAVDLVHELEVLGFEGKPGEAVRLATRGGVSAPLLIVAGLGDHSTADAERLRRGAAAVAAATERIGSVATTLHRALDDLDPDTAVRAVVEGLRLGAYRYAIYKTEPEPHRLERVVLHGSDGDVVAAAVEVAQVTSDAVVLVRDLVNLPPADKRPPAFAEQVSDLVSDLAIEVRVLDEHALTDGGYGAILGVGRGSSTPPRLVELTYQPDGVNRHIALVGKGITFDSGGLSLKASKSMETMKMDMAGAATVLGAVIAAARLELPVRLTGILALAENMPSGSATRLADVLKARDGTTIEVLNTDAEGRLVLADALAHAGEAKPETIIDLATLTGAALVALGDKIGALMSNDDELAEALLAAAERAGEPHWRLPLGLEPYGEELKGDVGDIKNSGWKDAGTIRGGIFLHHFVPDGIPWAHLDIAGVAWADPAFGYHPKGGTGVPVRTIIEWLRA